MDGAADLDALPSPPRALAAVIRAARSADVSVDSLGKVVGSDPAFALRVLKMANSPIYGQRSSISSVRRAIAILGARALRNIALCAATQACVNRGRLGNFELNKFWEASIQRAAAARILAEHDEQLAIDPSEAFTASLLQDLGVLALVLRAPHHADAWNKLANLEPAPRLEAERALFGGTHPEIATEICAAWELPDELAAPMQFHHAPAAAPAPQRSRVRLAHDAELLAAVLTSRDAKHALSTARAMVQARPGIGATVETLLEQLPNDVHDAARALGLRIDAQPTLQEILVDANRGLSELNLSYEELLHRLERTLAEKDQLARTLESRNRELEQLSLTDTLTNLPNRRAFWGRCVYEINRIARSGEPLVIAMGDLDYFKSVNDSFGHDFGDQVLEAASATFSETIRTTDMVARIGGEEFGFIFPGTDLEGGLVAARKINAQLRTTVRLATGRGGEYGPTVSIGLTILQGPFMNAFNPDDVVVRLLKRADQALYAAKDAGRDRVAHDPEPLPWK